MKSILDKEVGIIKKRVMTKKELFSKHNVNSYKITTDKVGLVYIFGNSKYREVNGDYVHIGEVEKVQQASGIPKTLGRKWSR